MSKISVGDYVRLKDGHEKAYQQHSWRDEEDPQVALYKEHGSLRDTSDIGVVTHVAKDSQGNQATVEGFTRLSQTEEPRRISYAYKETALVKVDEVVKKQISWFFDTGKAPGGGGAAAAGGGAAAKGGLAGAAPINTARIDDGTFFGFDRNERDDLLHISTNRPDALFDNGKMTFKQFIHGLSLVGNPSDKSALKVAMDAYEKKIVVNYKTSSGADYRLVEGAAPGAYRRFWDNMYWVLSSFSALKCPVRVNDEFNKKDCLFVDCLKIGLDLLPADHPHKAPFLAFMLEVKAPEFRAQAKRHFEDPSTRQNMVTKFQKEGCEHYKRAFTDCNGTIADHEWSNVWLLGNIGPAPQFAGWNPGFNMPNLTNVVKDYVLANIDPSLLAQEEEDADEGY